MPTLILTIPLLPTLTVTYPCLADSTATTITTALPDYYYYFYNYYNLTDHYFYGYNYFNLTDYYYKYNEYTQSTTAFGETTMTHACADWCAGSRVWGWQQKCKWADCAACLKCNGESLFATPTSRWSLLHSCVLADIPCTSVLHLPSHTDLLTLYSHHTY